MNIQLKRPLLNLLIIGLLGCLNTKSSQTFDHPTIYEWYKMSKEYCKNHYALDNKIYIPSGFLGKEIECVLLVNLDTKKSFYRIKNYYKFENE